MSDETEARAANVVEALSRVIRDMPGIGKDSQSAAAQGGYRYRGIEAITREAAPLFAKHGVVFVPRVVDWERDQITVANKPWTDDRVMTLYRVFGPGGREDYIEVGPIPSVGRDNSDKGTNKALTQAFKYALIQVLCIGDSKDDADGQTHERDVFTPTAVLGEMDVENAKPRELAAALSAAGLPAGGTVGEMKARLREAIAAQAAAEFVGAEAPSEATKADGDQPADDPGPTTTPEPTLEELALLGEEPM